VSGRRPTKNPLLGPEAHPGPTPRSSPAPHPAASFEEAVGRVLAGLRPGEVVTYGEVALEAGFPGAARAVGRILATSGGSFPWWRVVTASGRLVPGHEAEHARRLAGEGVDVSAGRIRWPRRSAGPLGPGPARPVRRRAANPPA
jgi:methylated-DNA-protein-cysteine methyltransferase-like protein